MINYLIEVSICLVAFYVCYWVALSRVKLLNLNRGYLLTTLLLGLSIPLLDISLYQTEVSFTPAIPDYIGAATSLNPLEIKAGEQLNPILLIWVIGTGISGLAFMLRLIRIIRLISKSPVQRVGWLSYVSCSGNQSVSSFFHYVFIPENLDLQPEGTDTILKHEEKHARDWHSLDLLLVELVSVFLWFNPVTYLYRKALKLQHEYIADEAVVHSCDKTSYTDLLVRYSLKQSGFSLAHSFSEHPVEKRLKMIDNSNPTTMKKLRSLLSLPLIFSLILVLGIKDQAYSQTLNVEFETRSNLKLVKGSVSDGELGETLSNVTIFILNSRNKILKNADGRYNGTMTNAKGNYGLGLGKSDSLIVFRKKGYESIIVPYKGQDIINVNLTKEAVSRADGNG